MNGLLSLPKDGEIKDGPKEGNLASFWIFEEKQERHLKMYLEYSGFS